MTYEKRRDERSSAGIRWEELRWDEGCSVKCGARRVQCEVCSVECEDCQVWSVKWSFKCDMWNKTPVSQSARTHGLGWRTAHASSIDEKGLIYIYIFKATSARLVRVLLVYIYLCLCMCTKIFCPLFQARLPNSCPGLLLSSCGFSSPSFKLLPFPSLPSLPSLGP